MLLLTALLLLLLAELAFQQAVDKTQRDFIVATSTGDSSSNSNKQLYYIYRDHYYALPPDVRLEDLFDAKHLPHKARLVHVSSSITEYAALRGYSPGVANQSVGTFRRQANSLDEVMGEMLRKLHLLQPVQPIKRVFAKVEQFNTAIVAFEGGLLSSHRGKVWIDHNVYFSWLQIDGTVGLRAAGLGLSAQHLSTLNGSFYGTEDVRFIMHPADNHTLLALHTSIYRKVGGTMFNVVSATEITTAPGPAEMQQQQPLCVTKHYKLMTVGEENVPSSLHQKSWVPFEHNGSVLIVKHIQPLTVLRLSDESLLRNHRLFDASLASRYNSSTAFVPCDIVSQQSCPQLYQTWEYGELRGGSNAVLLKRRGEYLSLFHTRSPMRHREPGRITYFMGAYTFSANPPFRLTGVSYVPLALDQWYQGEWFPSRHVDYVVFPTSLLVDEAAGTAIASVGHNDKHSFLLQLDLLQLLDSIAPLECVYS